MSSTPMSLAQFGQTIKEKHPEYNDLADEDVGQKVIAKYPQYADMVQQAPKSVVPQQMLDTLKRNINSRAGGMGYDSAAVQAPAPSDTGIIPGAIRAVKNIAGLGSAALSGPQTPEEQAVVDAAKTNPVMGQSALALYRLGIKPSLDSIDKANLYDLKAQAAPETSTQTYSPQHMGNVFRAGAMIPGVGPMAANLVERAGGGDVSGAIAEGTTYRGAANAVEAAGNLELPSTKIARAGGTMNAVKAAAGDVPVNLADTGNVALRTQELAQAGGSMPKVVRDFLRRASDPSKGPMTYAEAQDFYSNATRLSADEFNRLTPTMQRQMAMFTDSLAKSMKGAADQVGMGDQLVQGKAEYSQGMKSQDNMNALKQALVKGAVKSIPYGIGGLLAGAGYKMSR